MALISDKTTEIILGVSITGLVSTVVWLLKECDRLDRECHDLKRDTAHLQRTDASLSLAISEIDKENERTAIESGRYFGAVEKRFNRIEVRLNSLFSRRASDIQIKPDE